MTLQNKIQENPSRFVNAIAWIGMIYSLYKGLSYLVNVFVSAGFGFQEFDETPRISIFDGQIQMSLGLLMGIAAAVYFLYFIVAFALLKRKSWSRPTFVALMILGGGYGILAFIYSLQVVDFDDIFTDWFKLFFFSYRCLMLLISIGLWGIAWRLTKPEIVAEFQH